MKNQLIDFLIELVDREMEQEYDYTNDKDWILRCIQAKKWLLKEKKTLPIILDEIINEDKENYLK